MKLSEYLRSNFSDNSVRVIVRTNVVGSTQVEYGEIKVLSKINAENETLYHIQYMSDYCGGTTGSTRVVDESWCAKCEIVKIFQ